MLKYRFSLSIILTEIIFIAHIYGYQIIKEISLNSKADCAKEIEQKQWTFVGTNLNTYCYYQCPYTNLSTENPAFIFSSNTDANLQFSTSLIGREEFSVVGIDLIFFSSNNDISIKINDLSYLIDNTKYTVFEQTQTFQCPDEIHFASASLTYKDYNKKNLVFELIKTKQLTRVGIRAMRIWTNCALNCEVCLSSTSCSRCKKGYQIHTVGMTDICELGPQDCSQELPNCYRCLITQNDHICLQCIHGYTLDRNKNICSKDGSCLDSQFYDQLSKQCLPYSSSCYYQSKGTYNFTACPSSISKIALLRCPPNQMVIVYDQQNYSEQVCGCLINNCQNCINSNKCLTCEPGFKYDNNKLQCVPDCQENEYLDEQSNSCKSCLGQSCLSCEKNKCTKCLEDNQNIDPQNPLNCISCSIQNCENCFVPNKCYKCKSDDYDLDTITFQCKLKCKVNHCSKCEENQSQLCKECSDQYVLSPDQLKCIDKCSLISNCLACSQEDRSKCAQCYIGYLIDSNGQCIDKCTLIQNCSECSQDKLKCTKCIKGFYINQNSICEDSCSLIQNCTQCKGNERETCIHCKRGYSLDVTSNQCKDNCSQIVNCLQCQDQDRSVCVTCRKGFKLSQDSLSCIDQCQEIENCKRCSDSSLICLECKIGYTLANDGQRCIDNCSQINNCLLCPIENRSICELCKDGYKVSSQKNSCIQECKLKNCEKCQFFNQQMECQTCKKNYFINKLKNQCDLCSVQNCKQCNKFSTECMICDEGYLLIEFQLCQKHNYQEVQEVIDLNLKQQVKEDGYVIRVRPDRKFNYIPVDTDNLLEIQISNIEKYNYKLIDINNDEVILLVNVEQNVKEQILTLNIIDTNFVQINKISHNRVETNLQPFVKINHEQQQQIKQVNAATKSVAQSMVSTFIPVIIFGNFYIFINMIDMTGYLYYLLYVNIRLPKNVLDFFEVFKNFQFPFIPNLFEDILPTDYVQTSPKKFMEMESDCYFIKNAGQSMTITSSIIILYLIIKILSRFQIEYLQRYLQKKLAETWEYGAFFDMLGTVYIYALVGVLLQFYVFDISNKETYLVNYTLFSVYSVLCFSIPFLLVYLLYRQKNLKDDQLMQKKLSSFVGGLKLFNSDDHPKEENINKQEMVIQCLDSERQQDAVVLEVSKDSKDENSQNLTKYINLNNGGLSQSSFNLDEQIPKSKRQVHIEKYSKYLNGIQYIRKLIFCSLIVYLHDYTVIQLCTISTLNVMSSFFYFYITPFERQSENIKNGICELFLLIIQIIAFLFIEDSQSQDEKDRINLGWIIVVLSSIIILWNFFVMIFDMLKELFSFIKSQLQSNSNNGLTVKVQPELIFSSENLQKHSHDNKSISKQKEEKLEEQSLQIQNEKKEVTMDYKPKRIASNNYISNDANLNTYQLNTTSKNFSKRNNIQIITSNNLHPNNSPSSSNSNIITNRPSLTQSGDMLVQGNSKRKRKSKFSFLNKV